MSGLGPGQHTLVVQRLCGRITSELLSPYSSRWPEVVQAAAVIWLMLGQALSLGSPHRHGGRYPRHRPLCRVERVHLILVPLMPCCSTAESAPVQRQAARPPDDKARQLELYMRRCTGALHSKAALWLPVVHPQGTSLATHRVHAQL